MEIGGGNTCDVIPGDEAARLDGEYQSREESASTARAACIECVLPEILDNLWNPNNARLVYDQTAENREQSKQPCIHVLRLLSPAVRVTNITEEHPPICV